MATLTLDETQAVYVEYLIVVDGTASGGDPDDIARSFDGYTILSGALNGGRDTYTINGGIVVAEMSRTDTVNITLDGQSVRLSDLVSSTGGEMPSVKYAAEDPPDDAVTIDDPCIQDLHDLEHASFDGSCSQQVALLECPHGAVSYEARDSCEIGFLEDRGWVRAGGGGTGENGAQDGSEGMSDTSKLLIAGLAAAAVLS